MCHWKKVLLQTDNQRRMNDCVWTLYLFLLKPFYVLEIKSIQIEYFVNQWNTHRRRSNCDWSCNWGLRALLANQKTVARFVACCSGQTSHFVSGMFEKKTCLFQKQKSRFVTANWHKILTHQTFRIKKSNKRIALVYSTIITSIRYI